MDRTAEGDIQLSARAASDRDTTPRDVAVSRQQPPAPRPAPQDPPEAGQTVVVGDIPAQAPGFVPRAALLAELDRADTGVSVIHPAGGRHGVGATQLAAAYARAKLQAGWRLVAWVNGADPDSLAAGLAATAEAIGLSDHDAGRAGVSAAAVRQWLETDGHRCLLVIDDVSDARALDEIVPARGPARVLLIGQLASAGDLLPAISVDVFSAPEATDFLAGRTGLDDQAGAAAVAAVLGHLPLPLALAAPLVGALPTGYAGYLERLQAIAVDSALTGDDGQPVAPGLARAVLLSLQAVRAVDRTGVCTRVLELMSVLSPGGVRRDLLYAAGRAGVLVSGRQRVAAGPLDQVLKWLGGRSLLAFSLDGQTILVHPLVARVIRLGLEQRRELTAVCEAAAFVLDVYSRALVGSPDRWAARGVPQQVTALLAALAGSMTDVDDELAWLLLRLQFTAFYHLLELGDSTQQAIAVGEPLTQDLERLLGDDHPDTLNSRNSLATAYLSAGRVAEAITVFEQTLEVRRRILGLDDPDTLTSQNNLASAYQDAGRTDEAIQLYTLTLETRERLLGSDHPSTLNSSGNLAAAYQAASRVDEAIPLLERTLAGREKALGPDHPDTQTSRRNLARAYQDAGRGQEAIPLLERTSAVRPPLLRSDYPAPPVSSQNPSAAEQTAEAIRPARHPGAARPAPPTRRPAAPAAFRRPPAEPARRALPAGVRRPPADAARPPLPSTLAGRPARSARAPEHQGRPPSDQASDQAGDFWPDQEIVAAMAGENPAGLAMAYDRYAASLFGYCHWMLHSTTAAAEALTDTFAVAASRVSDLQEPATLRPWLFALARSECRRRIRPGAAGQDEQAELPSPSYEADLGLADETVQFSAIGVPMERASRGSDSTVQFPAFGRPAKAGGLAPDSTVQFPAFGRPAKAGGVAPDSTMQFRAIGQPAEVAREAFDTIPMSVVGLPPDAMTFMMVGPAVPRAADLTSDRAEAELRSLLHSVLAGLTPREREVIELTFTHDLNDDDLAIAFDMSWSRAHALAARARERLEEALSALHIALTRRESCAELGVLLADWDGQLTEQAREVVSWHITSCPTCAQHGWGAMRPAAFGRLLPPAPLPAELREQVLSRGTSQAQDAVAYRRKVARRADAQWLSGLSQALRKLSWASIRAHPGVAIAAAAVGLWVVAAVSVSLLTFAGHRGGPASAAQPAARPTHTQTARASTAAPVHSHGHGRPTGPVHRPALVPSSPAISSPPASQPLVSSPPTSPQASGSPSHPTTSSSPKPSKSPSASHSASPSPSPSASPSSSPSASPSPSPSP